MRLRAYLAFRSWTARRLASEIGAHEVSVGRYLNGKSRPSLPEAVAIERVTADWPEGPIEVVEWLETTAVTTAPAAAADEAPPLPATGTE